MWNGLRVIPESRDISMHYTSLYFRTSKQSTHGLQVLITPLLFPHLALDFFFRDCFKVLVLRI